MYGLALDLRPERWRRSSSHDAEPIDSSWECSRSWHRSCGRRRRARRREQVQRTETAAAAAAAGAGPESMTRAGDDEHHGAVEPGWRRRREQGWRRRHQHELRRRRMLETGPEPTTQVEVGGGASWSRRRELESAARAGGGVGADDSSWRRGRELDAGPDVDSGWRRRGPRSRRLKLRTDPDPPTRVGGGGASWRRGRTSTRAGDGVHHGAVDSS